MDIYGPKIKYRITAEGTAWNESFRGKVARWYEGIVFKFPYSDMWRGTLLNALAQYPEEGLTLYELWYKVDLLPYQVEDTAEDLLKRGLIESVPSGEPSFGDYAAMESMGHPIGPARPFPETYGDWVNLAEDIKDKVDTPEYAEVNFQLGIIGGLEEGDPEEAKRWLATKARELGIT